MAIRASARAAGLAALVAAALWTALVLAAPVLATNVVAGLISSVAAGVVVAVWHRRVSLALLASALSALLIALVISWVLPSIPGFVGHDHPPIYTPATRMTDPIGLPAFAVLLIVILGAHALRTRARTRRFRAPAHRAAVPSPRIPGPNEMVVQRTADHDRGARGGTGDP
ncbi:hypothetical protein [Paractinoplanes atraurantiacus]|uniref:Uncharacterized protein n=1 Tax=Paractinoplanes atraurantiacus TaxID=1036182 RepID=A0A285JYW2_9ACTN|nr:hypothetical protein [Actinoplanes atraurantiacus]SNY65480.1 hypothetical protein SAMN05421748_12859 [Actinoplanes atraurantiacus]